MANTYIIDTKYQGFKTISSDYILTPADHLQWLRVDTSVDDVNITIPQSNPGSPFFPGWNCTLENTSNGFVNIVSAGGVTFEAPANTIEDINRAAQIFHTNVVDTWVGQGYLGPNDLTSLIGVTTTAPPPEDYNALAFSFQSQQWIARRFPRYFLRDVITQDYTLIDSDHRNLLIVDTTTGPVDIIQNNGVLTPGFDCEVVNVGAGIVHFVGAGNIISESGSPALNALVGAWQRGRIHHQNLENYYLMGDWFPLGD